MSLGDLPKLTVMKHLSTLVFLLFVALNLGAQSDRRGLYLDGGNPLLRYASSNLPRVGANAPSADFDSRLDELSAQVVPVGYFISRRVMVGARLAYHQGDYRYLHTGYQFPESENTATIRPFLRYYPLRARDRKWDAFAELGFGRLGLKGNSGWETDFHLAAGVERRLAPGVLATARLSYNAFATDLNYTVLEIGPRILPSALGAVSDSAPLRAGTLFSRGQLLRGSFGHMDRQGRDWTDFNLRLTPSGGYFVIDGLAVTADFDLEIRGSSNEIRSDFFGGAEESNGYSVEGAVGLAYFPLRAGRLLPHLAASYGYYAAKLDGPGSDFTPSEAKGPLARLGIGATYFLSDAVALEGSASYTSYNEQLAGNTGLPTRNQARNVLSAQAGFAIYLPGN